MERPSFRIYHHSDCAETAQFTDILGQFNLQYETFVVGTDITESDFETLFGESNPCPRVLCCNNHQNDVLRLDSRGDEWMNIGSVEMTKKFVLEHNELESFN